MILPSSVKIVEVGPRDGLQNEASVIPQSVKVALIDRLLEAGFPNIEAASFVSPKWVPQMAGAAEVLRQVRRRPGTVLSSLVPNMIGLENALLADVDEIVVFAAASEAFSNRNINCSIRESIERFAPVATAAKTAGKLLRGSVSCAFGCPYQGNVTLASVVDVVMRLRDLGCDEIDIADTIGVATPAAIEPMFEQVSRTFPLHSLSGHYHDTHGQAIANIYASLQCGVRIFHASVAGLGGCPYARGATGNVATEDVLYLMHGMGIETGINMAQVVATGQWIAEALGRPYTSRAGAAWAALHSLSEAELT